MTSKTTGQHPHHGVAGLALGLTLALLAPALTHAGEMAPDQAAQVGAPAPQFTLMDADGKSHALKDYAGKIVVLEWTNQTCPFVQRHYKAKTMVSLVQKYTPKGVTWLAINSTYNNKPAETAQWTKDQGLPYLTLLDPTGEVGRMYGAKTTPHMFIIDQHGKLAFAGAIDDNVSGDVASPKNYVDAALTDMLAGKPVEIASPKSYGCSVKYAPTAGQPEKTVKSAS